MFDSLQNVSQLGPTRKLRRRRPLFVFSVLKYCCFDTLARSSRAKAGSARRTEEICTTILKYVCTGKPRRKHKAGWSRV